MRKLNDYELEKVNALLSEIRTKLEALAVDDADLLFALRRKVYKELSYDERSKPMVRRKLKQLKYDEQDGKCAICGRTMPLAYSELDRLHAPGGYTQSNTQLVHAHCHHQSQRERGYA